ncbi:flippase [Flagellimonas lutimaris]|nr:flippase [Allomuricauda lutimaris]
MQPNTSKSRLLKNKSGFIKYFKNTSWLMGERIFRLAIALTVGVMVTRYLGPEDFGTFSYAQSFVGLFTAFSSLGLTDILVRELLKSKEKHYELMGTSFWLQTFGSCFIMVSLICFVLLNNNKPLTNKIILIVGFTTFLHSFNVITSFFNSQVKSKFNAIPAFLGITISSLLKIYGIWQQASLIFFVYILVFDTLFLALGQIYYYIKSSNRLKKWTFKRATAKALLKDSWPLILSGIVISIYMKIDQIMIKELISNAAVGQYAAAVRLSEAWYFIPMIICTSVFPAILNAKTKSIELYKERLSNLYDLMVFLGIAVIIPVLLFADWGIQFLYGSDFDQTAFVLKIHIWAGVFVFLGVANRRWFISENLQVYQTICLGFGMITNIILNIIMIPKLGIAGAAYATLISQFVASVLAPAFFSKTRESFYMMIQSLLFISFFNKILRR